MNHFQLEKQILQKLHYTQAFIDKLKLELANLIICKSKKVGVITKDLKEKCLKEVKKQKKQEFQCKFCLKVFAEGRQLGGHVSRAHKNIKDFSNAESEKSFVLREKGPIRRVKMMRKNKMANKQFGSIDEKNKDKYSEDDSIFMMSD